MFKPMALLLSVLGLTISSARGQVCKNFGLSNGTACACPVGYGGQDCGAPACGGTLFQGSSRQLTSDFGNITSAGCKCESGWMGEGCNVCQNSNACSASFASVSSTNPISVTGQDSGQNNTMTCNSGAIVYAAGQMSCNVNVRLLTSTSL
jgi:hypothetical protein